MGRKKPQRKQPMNDVFSLSSWNEAPDGRDPITIGQGIGQEAEAIFANKYKQLQTEVLEVQPSEMISAFALRAFVWINGVDPELASRSPILEWQVELLQALALRHRPEEFRDKPQQLSKIEELLVAIQESSLAHNLKSLNGT